MRALDGTASREQGTSDIVEDADNGGKVRWVATKCGRRENWGLYLIKWTQTIVISSESSFKLDGTHAHYDRIVTVEYFGINLGELGVGQESIMELVTFIIIIYIKH